MNEYQEAFDSVKEVNLYDYVNGSRVEEIKEIDGEPHYLIAYFDWGAKKPQSRWLPDHLITSYVTAEDFERAKQ